MAADRGRWNGIVVIEVTAMSVGAGILLGGFVVGTAQRLACAGIDRGRGDDPVVDAGYAGGWIAAAALVIDLLVR